jgi:hypothetical protein
MTITDPNETFISCIDSIDAETKIDEDPKFFDVGERKLKGLEMPEKLYSIYPGKYIGRHDAYLSSLNAGGNVGSPLKPSHNSVELLVKTEQLSNQISASSSNTGMNASVNTNPPDIYVPDESILVDDELKPIQQFSYIGKKQLITLPFNSLID